jgi:hypothetical protein
MSEPATIATDSCAAAVGVLLIAACVYPHIHQKSVFRGCDVDDLQRNLSLLDTCAVGAQRAQ